MVEKQIFAVIQLTHGSESKLNILHVIPYLNLTGIQMKLCPIQLKSPPCLKTHSCRWCIRLILSHKWKSQRSQSLKTSECWKSSENYSHVCVCVCLCVRDINGLIGCNVRPEGRSVEHAGHLLLLFFFPCQLVGICRWHTDTHTRTCTRLCFVAHLNEHMHVHNLSKREWESENLCVCERVTVVCVWVSVPQFNALQRTYALCS